MGERVRSGGRSEWNLNSWLGLFGIVAPIVGAVLFLAPLNTLPEDVRGMRKDVGEVQRTQASQAQSIEILADQTKEIRELRRDVDKNTTTLDGVKHRLERLESAK